MSDAHHSPSSSRPRKSFYPLESNPDVFNQLLHLLGVSGRLKFIDIYSLDDPEFLPHPTIALILALPEGPLIKAYAASDTPIYDGSGKDEPVIWFKQTIHNACGLYAVLHALSNGDAADNLHADGFLSRLLTLCVDLRPDARALALESSSELESIHHTVAVQGDSRLPESADAEVDTHYICFVKSNKDGFVYELDGDQKGPVKCKSVYDGNYITMREGQDLVGNKDVLGLVRRYISEAGGDLGFSLLALVVAEDNEK